MAGHVHAGSLGTYLPKASTNIAKGDLVMLDKITGRIEPLTKDRKGQHLFVGICDEKWNATAVLQKFGATSTEYATPTVGQAELPVYHGGVAKLAISDTSGKAGQLVYLSTATSGAQIFTRTRQASGKAAVPVGKIDRDFSGAAANDEQWVQLFARGGNAEDDMQFYLMNHIVTGFLAGFDDTSRISHTAGAAFIDGDLYTFAAAANVAIVSATLSTTFSRVGLFVINSAGAKAVRLSQTYLGADGIGATTALGNSIYWPTTSYLIYAAGYIASSSTDLAAANVKTIRRGMLDIMYRRYVSNS